jgi:hypothetical protein
MVVWTTLSSTSAFAAGSARGMAAGEAAGSSAAEAVTGVAAGVRGVGSFTGFAAGVRGAKEFTGEAFVADRSVSGLAAGFLVSARLTRGAGSTGTVASSGALMVVGVVTLSPGPEGCRAVISAAAARIPITPTPRTTAGGLIVSGGTMDFRPRAELVDRRDRAAGFTFFTRSVILRNEILWSLRSANNK